MDGQPVLDRKFSNVSFMRLQDGMQKGNGYKAPTARHGRPWTDSWTGCRRIRSTASAVCALRGGIRAAHAPVAPERTYGKEKIYG